MRSLREMLAEFQKSGRAVGHFNISDSNQLRAIAAAVREASLPAIIGLSEGEREYFPLAHARALVEAYRAEGLSLYLNADHTYSAAKARAAIDAGADSVVIDGAALPIEENIAMVKEVVAYARASLRDVLIEGELGYIGTSSKQLDTLPAGVSPENLTTIEDAARFVEETRVDCFAPAVGNVHGMLVHAREPALHPDRVRAIAEAVRIPLVLHGAYGNSESDVRACIGAGIAVVHINTELRVCYREALAASLAQSPSEVAPYKFLAPATRAMQEFVAKKLLLFAGK